MHSVQVYNAHSKSVHNVSACHCVVLCACFLFCWNKKIQIELRCCLWSVRALLRRCMHACIAFCGAAYAEAGRHCTVRCRARVGVNGRSTNQGAPSFSSEKHAPAAVLPVDAIVLYCLALPLSLSSHSLSSVHGGEGHVRQAWPTRPLLYYATGQQ